MLGYFSNKLPLYILLLICILFILLCRFNSNCAEWYITTVYPVWAKGMSFLSSKIPFSLYDIFWIVLILLFLGSIGYTIVLKKQWLHWLAGIVTAGLVIGCWFYLSWGISYFRHDFYERTTIPKVDFDSVSFHRFVTYYVEVLNNSYVNIDSADYNQVYADIEAGYAANKSVLHINYPCGARRVKRMIYEPVYSKMGISGYFGPFFNEVHVNFHPYLYEQLFVIAHEKAHQFGVSSEAECNLYAYVVCTTSDNAMLRYSGFYSALGYILNNARRVLPDAYGEIVGSIRPEVIDDYNVARERWLQARDVKLSDIQRSVYDTYLKSNKVASGVGNYSEMVALLVSWHEYKQ